MEKVAKFEEILKNEGAGASFAEVYCANAYHLSEEAGAEHIVLASDQAGKEFIPAIDHVLTEHGEYGVRRFYLAMSSSRLLDYACMFCELGWKVEGVDKVPTFMGAGDTSSVGILMSKRIPEEYFPVENPDAAYGKVLSNAIAAWEEATAQDWYYFMKSKVEQAGYMVKKL